MVTMDKLLFFIQKGYNVLFEGEHGIGKTALVKSAFEEAGLKWAYFSGATMDPYIDFCGVPVKVGEGNDSYIELIKPKHLATNEIQALFFDEFNRSHKKVRNAVMELIQFRTINGQPFSKDLRIVWAAINPDDEENTYNVEPMDPAQKDRFHVHLKFKYECCLEYFVKTFGEYTGKAAVQYWESLPDDQKKLVSPRRLEYALKAYGDGGDVRDILPKSCNPNRLSTVIKAGPAEIKLTSLMNDEEAAEEFLANENNYLYALKTIIANQKFIEFFAPLLPPEKIAILYIEESKIRAFIQKDLAEKKNDSVFSGPLLEVVVANQNVKAAEQIKGYMAKAGVACDALVKFVFNDKAKNDNAPIFGKIESLHYKSVSEAYKKTTKRTQALHAALTTWYGDIKDNVGPNPTIDTSRVALMGLHSFLSHARFHSVKKTAPDIMNLINHLLVSMVRAGKDWKFVRETVEQNNRIKWVRGRFGKTTLRDIEMYINSEIAKKKETVSTIVKSVVASKTPVAADAKAAKPIPPATIVSVPAQVPSGTHRTYSEVNDHASMEAVWKAYKGNGGMFTFEGIEKDPAFGLKFAKGNHARRIMLKWEQMRKSQKPQSPNITKMFVA